MEMSDNWMGITGSPLTKGHDGSEEMWSHGVMVSTQDSESCNPSSNLGGTFLFLSPFYYPPHSTSLSSFHFTHFPSLSQFHLSLSDFCFPTHHPSLPSPIPLHSKIAQDGFSSAMSTNKSQPILDPIQSVRFNPIHTQFKTVQSESISTMDRSGLQMSGCAVHLFFDFEFVKWIHFAVCPPRNRCQQCV